MMVIPGIDKTWPDGRGARPGGQLQEYQVW